MPLKFDFTNSHENIGVVFILSSQAHPFYFVCKLIHIFLNLFLFHYSSEDIANKQLQFSMKFRQDCFDWYITKTILELYTNKLGSRSRYYCFVLLKMLCLLKKFNRFSYCYRCRCRCRCRWRWRCRFRRWRCCRRRCRYWHCPWYWYWYC